MKKMVCLITLLIFRLSNPFWGLFFQVNKSCRNKITIFKMAEKRVHKQIKVFEN